MGWTTSDYLAWIGIKRPQGADVRDIALLAGAVAVLAVFQMIQFLKFEPHTRFFTEGDPSLSHPYIENADTSVPTMWNRGISWVLPLAVMGSFHLLAFNCERLHLGRRIHKRLLVSILWFVLCGLSTVVVTGVLKVYCGRLRPNFFAMCDYKGYRTALSQCSTSDDWQQCIANLGVYDIQVGKPGHIEFCTDQTQVHQAQEAYVSGHASSSMAGLGFLACFLHYSLDEKAVIRMLAPAVCVAGAMLVAASRTRDYWHNFSDINFGMSIGFAAAVFCGSGWKRHMLIEPVNMLRQPACEQEKSALLDAIGEQNNQVQDVESDVYYRIEPDP